jgi:DNA adenine methylase
MGSKRRLVKYLKPIIQEYITEDSIYIEPFVGGANIITEIECNNKIGYDINEYMIEFFNALKNKSFYPPDHITKDEYEYVRLNNDVNKPLTAWVGVGCSFGAKWFGSYAKDLDKQNKSRQLMARNGLNKQIPKLTNIDFFHKSYENIEIQENMVIYCDPPYVNTIKYKDDFNHERFWDWVRKHSEKCTILISEYEAPDDFEIIWQKEVFMQMNKDQKRIEKLFKIKG